MANEQNKPGRDNQSQNQTPGRQDDKGGHDSKPGQNKPSQQSDDRQSR